MYVKKNREWKYVNLYKFVWINLKINNLYLCDSYWISSYFFVSAFEFQGMITAYDKFHHFLFKKIFVAIFYD